MVDRYCKYFNAEFGDPLADGRFECNLIVGDCYPVTYLDCDDYCIAESEDIVERHCHNERGGRERG